MQAFVCFCRQICEKNKVVRVYNYSLFESLVTCRLKYIKVFVNDVLVILKQLICH